MGVSVPLVVLLVVITGAGAAEKAPVVVTEEGSISGVVEESVKGRTFYSYYGVPYAKPPLGPLRFKDPEVGEKWNGVVDGSRMLQPCLQISFEPFIFNRKAVDQDYFGVEDCLYLNVFTPKPREEGKKLPVMVWIHGGGFFSGGAPDYLPHPLMEHDVVVVVIQYRLGILGFLSTEDEVIPGNFGLKDQTLALRWVQRNIHHFGGDKTLVTIFGESAGGASVHYQMLTPFARGLFARAILMSGTSLCPWACTANHAEIMNKVTQALDCPIDQGSEKILSCLQTLDNRTIIHQTHDLFDWYMLPVRMGPRVDGVYLPAEPGQLIQEGRVAPVDLMSGVTRDEGAFFSHGVFSTDSISQELKDNFSKAGPVSIQLDKVRDPEGLAQKVYHYYLGGTHVSRNTADQFNKMMSHRHFQVCQDLASIHHVTLNRNTYSYELQHRGQLSLSDLFLSGLGKNWVSHIDDLYYLFRGGNFLSPPHLPPSRPKDLVAPEELRLRDIMTKLWTNFAATGQPTPDTSLGFTWERMTPDHFQYLSLTPAPAMMPDTRQEVRRFHSSLATSTNKALHPHLVEDQDTNHQPKNEL